MSFPDAVISRGVDNVDVGFSLSGPDWRSASGGSGFIGSNFQVVPPANVNSGNAASWSLSLSPGTYEVYVTYSRYTNRATNAPYRVYHSDGAGGTTSTVVPVNQREGSPTLLGTFTFGEAALVELTDAANGALVADSVRWELVGEDSDADGLPDQYQEETFGNLTTSDGESDSDGDSIPDIDEVLAGTNPLEPNTQHEMLDGWWLRD